MEEDILNYLPTVMFRGTLCIKDFYYNNHHLLIMNLNMLKHHLVLYLKLPVNPSFQFNSPENNCNVHICIDRCIQLTVDN